MGHIVTSLAWHHLYIKHPFYKSNDLLESKLQQRISFFLRELKFKITSLFFFSSFGENLNSGRPCPLPTPLSCLWRISLPPYNKFRPGTSAPSPTVQISPTFDHPTAILSPSLTSTAFTGPLAPMSFTKLAMPVSATVSFW